MFCEGPTASEVCRIPAGVLADMAGSILDKGRRVTFEVRGDSMLPTLRSGDRVTVAPPGERSLRPGCLVAWRNSDSLVVHRFVQMLPDDRFLTAGDAVDHRDAPTPGESLLGVVISVERDGKSFLPVSGRLMLLCMEIRRIPAWVRRRVSRLFKRRER